jgi:hypothetical protein
VPTGPLKTRSKLLILREWPACDSPKFCPAVISTPCALAIHKQPTVRPCHAGRCRNSCWFRWCAFPARAEALVFLSLNFRFEPLARAHCKLHLPWRQQTCPPEHRHSACLSPSLGESIFAAIWRSEHCNVISEVDGIAAKLAADLHSPKELCQGDVKCKGDFLNVYEGQVALASLNPTHVSPVQSAHIGEFLLRHPQLLASASDRFAKPNSDVYGCHSTCYLVILLLICPRTISIIRFDLPLKPLRAQARFEVQLDFSSTGTRTEFLLLSLKKEKPQGSRATRGNAAPVTDEPTDETLMAHVQQGDKGAMGCLFRRYARPVRNVGHRILRDIAHLLCL